MINVNNPKASGYSGDYDEGQPYVTKTLHCRVIQNVVFGRDLVFLSFKMLQNYNKKIREFQKLRYKSL